MARQRTAKLRSSGRRQRLSIVEFDGTQLEAGVMLDEKDPKVRVPVLNLVLFSGGARMGEMKMSPTEALELMEEMQQALEFLDEADLDAIGGDPSELAN